MCRLPCCIVCGEPIGGDGTWWCHPECAVGDGFDLTKPRADWPDWALDLIAIEEPMRVNERWRRKRGIELVNIDDYLC